jgi:hypothetical protein
MRHTCEANITARHGVPRCTELSAIHRSVTLILIRVPGLKIVGLLPRDETFWKFFMSPTTSLNSAGLFALAVKAGNSTLAGAQSGLRRSSAGATGHSRGNIAAFGALSTLLDGLEAILYRGAYKPDAHAAGDGGVFCKGSGIGGVDREIIWVLKHGGIHRRTR